MSLAPQRPEEAAMSNPEIVPSYESSKEYSLRINAVDRVSSALLGSLVLVLLGVSFFGVLFFMSSGSIENKNDELIGSKGSGGVSELALDFDEPNPSEVDALPVQTTESIMHFVSYVSTDLSQASEWEFSKLGQANGGEGRTSKRAGGVLDEGMAIPRSDRWELRFSARDMRSYGQQISAVGMELGVYGAGIPKVEYAFNVDNPTPSRREGLPQDEKRLYFLSLVDNALLRFDRELLKRARIDSSGRNPMKFLSQQTESRLVEMEIEFGTRKFGAEFSIDKVVKTVFECRQSKGDGFEFVVLEQRYKAIR